MNERIPFLFKVGSKFIVKISHFDYMSYNSSWIDNMPEECLVPDVNITTETKEFNSESEAIAFIGKWWTEESDKPCSCFLCVKEKK